MITAIVRFSLPEAMPIEKFTELSEANAPKYKRMQRVTAAHGSAPDIDWFDSPVVVDNRHDEIVT